MKLNLEKAVEGATLLLEGLGVSLDDPNYEKTPERMAEALSEFTSALREGHQEEMDDLFKVFPSHNDTVEPYRGMLQQGPIRVYSLCSHHMLPVVYDVYMAYIPKPGQQLGFSKTIRIIRELAKRPMNQEDLTQRIMDQFQKHLPEARGIAAIVVGTHFCMKMRGVQSDTINKTSAVHGDFKDYERTRDEFLALASNFHQQL